MLVGTKPSYKTNGEQVNSINPNLTYPWLDEMLCGQRHGKIGKEHGKRIQIRVQGECIIVQQDTYIRRAVGLDEWLQAN